MSARARYQTPTSEIRGDATVLPIAITDGIGTGAAAELFFGCGRRGLALTAAGVSFGKRALGLGRQDP